MGGGVIENTKHLILTVSDFSKAKSNAYVFSDFFHMDMWIVKCLESISMIIFFFFAFVSKKTYVSCFSVCTFFALYTSDNGYIFIFFIIPLLLFIKNEATLNRNNMAMFIFIILYVLPIPIYDEYVRVIYNETIELLSALYLILNWKKIREGSYEKENISNGSLL